jgi:hypothetical protein
MKKKTNDVEYLISEVDKVEILRLAKIAVATGADCDSIYSLFKKYINPKAAMYRTDCNCYTSIGNYWQLLIEFYSENNSKTK